MHDEVGHIIEEWRSQTPLRQLSTARMVFNDLIGLWTLEDDIFLSTDFSRLAFFIQKNKLTGKTKLALYTTRAQINQLCAQGENYKYQEELLVLLNEVFSWFERFARDRGQIDFQLKNIPDIFLDAKKEVASFIGHQRLLLMGRAERQRQFYAINENRPEQEFLLELPEYEDFTQKEMSDHLGSVIPFPSFIEAFEIEVREGILYPSYYVLLPDYLVDVTAIAGGFQSSGFSIWTYYTRRVLPSQTTFYMLLGNIVNHMLDRMIVDEDLSLNSFYKDVFRLFPLDLIHMEDRDVIKLLEAIQMHFRNLKKVVNTDFPAMNLDPAKFELEPAFLSSRYGLQGRLDVLHRNEETTIIELKSGKPYRPNAYGIKVDHYVQTLLYDLIIRSTGISRSPRNFILYSRENQKAMKYAPPVKKIQVEALMARNEIVILDALFRHEDPNVVYQVFQAFDRNPPDDLGSFIQRDVNIIRQVFHSASDIEIQYYRSFFSFIMREMAIAKIGRHGSDKTSGLASMWLKNEDQKNLDFSILSHLKMTSHKIERGNVFLNFDFTDQTDRLANFRVGDVVVLYPQKGEYPPVLHNQVHKSSIVDKRPEGVTIKLRSKQYDDEFFNSTGLWCVERDVLDSSFNSSFDSLFLFLGAPESTRRLLLGLKAPVRSKRIFPENYAFSEHLLPEQIKIIRQIYACDDYFLLWGPPGTGKTSIMIRELVKLYFDSTSTDIYLLAYTNRAVDELCASIASLGEGIAVKSVRIGSSQGCGREYRDWLFDRQIEDIGDREGLRSFISQKRIIISTIASFWGRRQVIKNDQPGILIVDEASQILEPSIIGLLPYFRKFILVGDHLQLPAVSTQQEDMARIRFEELSSLGIVNMKTSFFERLYNQHEQKGWTDHRAILRFQGRMHASIMKFVNKEFYEGGLRGIPEIARLTDEQGFSDEWSRMIYVSSRAFPEDPMIKNNLDEANKVVRAVSRWLKLKGSSIEDLSVGEIGIITPFRAQIALIRYRLNEAYGTQADKITVDTVERYQGSARDVIIISLCLNRAHQLNMIVSESDGGVDRKFNVAITRARENVIVIGNRDLMSRVRSYKAFIDQAKEVEL